MKKGKQKHVDPEMKIENALTTTELFIERNIKPIVITVIAALVIAAVAVWINYSGKNRQKKAAEMAIAAQQYFEEGDFQLALDGDSTSDGFLTVIDKYGKTPTGNLAKHYAALCYIELGDNVSAEEYLLSYKKVRTGKTVEPAAIINAQNRGLLGDMASDRKEYEKAVKYYNEAVAMSDNDLTAPMYLKKAGLVYEQLGDWVKALESYKKIKSNYPGSVEVRDIDKYIGRAQQR